MSAPFHNVFAVLVHEAPDLVVELVHELRDLDPASTVLLYDGSETGALRATLDGLVAGVGVIVHPRPRPMRWGRLHGFALDCMEHALATLPFDAMTMVDSDQLLIRPGWSEAVAATVASAPGAGLLGNAPHWQPPDTTVAPAMKAWEEVDRWVPVIEALSCAGAPAAADLFPYWTFWPSTVFTRNACAALVDAFAKPSLESALAASGLWATEEILLPTVVRALGFAVVESPGSFDYVRFKVDYDADDLADALSRRDVFWVHPVPRVAHHPTRRALEEHRRRTSRGRAKGDAGALRSQSVLQTIRPLDGWLSDAEADLLLAVTADAVRRHPAPHHIVELGSFCGKSTVVLAAAARHVDRAARVYAVDPHEGVVGELDRPTRGAPTLTRFLRNLADAGVADSVGLIQALSFDVDWDRPICMLLIDALHDFTSVVTDLSHFEPWLVDGATVAFHDDASYYPGIVAAIDWLLDSGRYRLVETAESLTVLRRDRGPALPDLHPIVSRLDEVDGWLERDEATLLALAVCRAVGDAPDGPSAVVEIGSFRGRGTVVLARTVCALGLETPVLAVDRHDGVVGARDGDLVATGPSRGDFDAAIDRAGVGHVVRPVEADATLAAADWRRPVDLLVIDGLHDRASVAADVAAFTPRVRPGGLMAFHDDAPYYPGVGLVVDDLLASGRFRRLAKVGTLTVVEKAVTPAPARAVPPVRPRDPVASCVMLTHGRRELARAAVAMFDAQDYPRRELVIVDSGAEPAIDLLPADTPVRYVRAPAGASLGALRNLGNREASGDVLIHWDDDDWMAPWRISSQVEELRASGAELCGLGTLLYYDPVRGQAWRYHYPSEALTWVADATFAYRRELWERHPLPDLSNGLDLAYLRSLSPGARVRRADDHSFYVARLHAGNSSRKSPASARWRPLDPGDLADLAPWLPGVTTPLWP